MADPFSNEPIPTDHLPRLTDDAFVPVDPRYLRVSLTGIAVTAVVVAIGAVVDFIDVHWRGAHWPAFNLADSAITLGAVLFAVHTLLEGRSAGSTDEDRDSA